MKRVFTMSLVVMLILITFISNTYASGDVKWDGKASVKKKDNEDFTISKWNRDSIDGKFSLKLEGENIEENSYDIDLSGKKLEIVVQVSGSKDKGDSKYEIILKDSESNTVKKVKINTNGKFSVAELDFNLNDFIDTSMGYDIKITDKKKHSVVVISSAPTFDMMSMGIYGISGLFLFKKGKFKWRFKKYSL